MDIPYSVALSGFRRSSVVWFLLLTMSNNMANAGIELNASGVAAYGYEGNIDRTSVSPVADTFTSLVGQVGANVSAYRLGFGAGASVTKKQFNASTNYNYLVANANANANLTSNLMRLKAGIKGRKALYEALPDRNYTAFRLDGDMKLKSGARSSLGMGGIFEISHDEKGTPATRFTLVNEPVVYRQATAYGDLKLQMADKYSIQTDARMDYRVYTDATAAGGNGYALTGRTGLNRDLTPKTQTYVGVKYGQSVFLNDPDNRPISLGLQAGGRWSPSAKSRLDVAGGYSLGTVRTGSVTQNRGVATFDLRWDWKRKTYNSYSVAIKREFSTDIDAGIAGSISNTAKATLFFKSLNGILFNAATSGQYVQRFSDVADIYFVNQVGIKKGFRLLAIKGSLERRFLDTEDPNRAFVENRWVISLTMKLL
jgi:hypothetical protein